MQQGNPANGQTGLGAVLVDNTGKVAAWFGMCLNQEQLAPFLNTGRQTIIGELETLAVALSLLVRHDLRESVQLMVHINNEGSKFLTDQGSLHLQSNNGGVHPGGNDARCTFCATMVRSGAFNFQI